MSNHLAIANVTAAIGQIAHGAAQGAVGGVGIRYGRPNATDTGGRVNVYLYQIVPNAALRNADLPTRSGTGGLAGRPTAALDLHYLVSFYGNAQLFEPDRMAGAVVRDLHARPVLDAATLANAVASNAASLTGSNLGQTLERVTLTPMSLTIDDMSRLWSLFTQAPHTLSVAYRAGVVLIDALESGPAPAPVLRRGDDGRGVLTSIDRTPRLTTAWVGFAASVDRQPPLPSLPVAMPGTLLRIAGTDLDGERLDLHFVHPRRADRSLTIAAADRSASEIRLAIPDDGADWAAGLYAVTAEVVRDGTLLRAPLWPLVLAPRVTGLSPNPAGPAGGSVAITVTTAPIVLATQAASLRAGPITVAAEPRGLDSDPLVFILDPAPVLAGALVRLTVDGAESLPVVIDAVSGDFAFDDGQRLTIA
ncbi:DUF4255 domain-containing protein [Polymorphobacter fuscus]|uniref:DUF4255 domain-containing protein n=1 Tax=Sandarakinorhabdus fusca TaxID=1439888 RepID=UPI0012980A18|nr:DUF4255 domain-containing protein [Polymorphobacter fuscus]NJC08725.1 hypothetical protein [Polymorphobacter fuscus]